MTVRSILRIGNPLLRQESRPVNDIADSGIKALVQDMLETMKDANGAGLAAPQIGVLSRVIIFGLDSNPRYPDVEPVPLTVLVNPEYEVIDQETIAGWEGCLSIPGMRGRVMRPKAIRYRGYDVEGEPVVRDAEGFHARVFLHEFDHLDGKLYIDRISDLSQFGYIPELEAAGLLPRVRQESDR